MNDLISVIIPVYNVCDYLEKCIESVCGQRYNNLEIILVDDGSTDGSGELCDKFACKDERIVVIHQENGGLSHARYTGLKSAKGKYITFLDSDDYIHENTYMVMQKMIENKNADVAIAGFKRVYDSNGCPEDGSGATVCVSGKEAARNIYKQGEEGLISLVAWNKLYRKNAISQEFCFPVGRIHEDEYTTYRLLYSLKKVVYIDNNFYYYRQRGDSIMHTSFSLARLDALLGLYEAVLFWIELNEMELAVLALERYLDRLMYTRDEWVIFHPEKNDVLQSLENEFADHYRKHIDLVKAIPCKRRFLYWTNLNCRILYHAIIKIRSGK